MSEQKATVSIIAAGVLWGCISLFLRPLSALGLSSLQIVAIRCCLAFVMLAGFLALRDPGLLRLRPRDLPVLLGTGLVSLLLFSWCYFGAIEASGVAVAVVLLYTSPVFILLLSAVLFHEPRTGRKLLALALTAAGCVLVTGLLSSGDRIGLKALLLGLGSGLFYALYSIFGRIALRTLDTMTITVYTFFFAGIGASVLSFFEGHAVSLSALLSPAGILSSLGIAFFACVLPYLFYTLGLSGVETGRAAILVTVEPAVGALIGFFVWHEEITAQKLLGIALIFCSILLLARSGQKRPAD